VITLVVGLVTFSLNVLLIEVRRRAHDVGGWIGTLFGVKLKREQKVAEIQDLANQILDARSVAIMNSWMNHHAAFSDLTLWHKCLLDFQEFQVGILEEEKEHELHNTPNIRPELIPVFCE
jgi:hypothetical protein